VSDRVESFRRPWVVPINGAAINDRRELPASISELFSNWRECKHDM
jgi:hypothetical protein